MIAIRNTKLKKSIVVEEWDTLILVGIYVTIYFLYSKKLMFSSAKTKPIVSQWKSVDLIVIKKCICYYNYFKYTFFNVANNNQVVI